jgi:hypothetical protein
MSAMTGSLLLLILVAVFVVAWVYLARRAHPKAKIGPDGTNVREPESFVVHHEGKGQGIDISNKALKERTEHLSADLPGSTHMVKAPVPGRDPLRLDHPPDDTSRFDDEKVAPGTKDKRTLLTKPSVAMEVSEEISDWSELNRSVPLPQGYHADELVALVRNPRSLYVYWEHDSLGERSLHQALGDAYGQTEPVLRIFDVTAGATTAEPLVIPLQASDDHCFITESIQPGRRYLVSFERRAPDGRFYLVSHSSTVETPNAHLQQPSAANPQGSWSGSRWR